MTSVVISFSQHANQLATHFNNIQNDRFLKNPQNTLPLRHISLKSIDNKIISNIYPRSILFDYANGTGHLDPFIYFEKQQSLNGVETIQTSSKIKKNEEFPKFWSDFANVSYKPQNLLSHPRYNYNPQTFESIGKFGSGSFLTHDQGIDAYNQIPEFNYASDEVVRKLFEDADTVSNVHSLVNLETAWSGVCAETLRSVIDDHLNGHGSYVILWSIQKSNKELNLDKIRKIVDFADLNVSGIFQFNSEIDGTPYERTKKYAVPFDYVANVDSTDEVVYKLTNGSRKFINSISFQDEALGINEIENNYVFASVDVKAPDRDDKVILSVTNSLKNDFKRMYEFVSRYCRSDQREELKDALATLRENYVYGYDSDSEFDDD